MHLRRNLVTAALTLAGLVPAGAVGARAAEPSSPAAPAAIVAYHDSGEWARDTAAVIAGAREQVEWQLAAGMRRPALVLDVDDTSLSSYRCLEAWRFDRSAGGSCAGRGRMPAIPETLGLYRHVRSRGVAVFFLTGRREGLRRVTLANLRRGGFAGAGRLVMRPSRERPGSHTGFKARERRRIERDGFHIVANVGDQRSDLTGGSALATFKLPNPMYVIRTA